MQQKQGELREIWLEPGPGEQMCIAGRIDCPPGLIPAPGQYLLAYAPELPDAPRPLALFPGRPDGPGMTVVPPLPADWLPGMRLELRGPLGKGFQLSGSAHRLALVAVGSPLRLLPLIDPIFERGGAAILFCDPPLPAHLPTALEVAPLAELPANLDWPDFIAVDFFSPAHPSGTLDPQIERLFASIGRKSFPCPGQALIQPPLPCGGLAECGACAVRTRSGWRLACKDGPVFDLSELWVSR